MLFLTLGGFPKVVLDLDFVQFIHNDFLLFGFELLVWLKFGKERIVQLLLAHCRQRAMAGTQNRLVRQRQDFSEARAEIQPGGESVSEPRQRVVVPGRRDDQAIRFNDAVQQRWVILHELVPIVSCHVKADRRISLREFIEKIFGGIATFKSKDELLEEEFEKFIAIYKPDSKYVLPIKNYLKAYITDGEIRDIMEKGEYPRLATNPASRRAGRVRTRLERPLRQQRIDRLTTSTNALALALA